MYYMNIQAYFAECLWLVAWYNASLFSIPKLHRTYVFLNKILLNPCLFKKVIFINLKLNKTY